MEIQQEFIYDVFWEQQLVSVEACLFLFFLTDWERITTEYRGKERKKKKQTDKKNNTLQTESTQSS